MACNCGGKNIQQKVEELKQKHQNKIIPAAKPAEENDPAIKELWDKMFAYLEEQRKTPIENRFPPAQDNQEDLGAV